MNTIESTYEIGDWLIYPKHGLGKAISYETQTILKNKVDFFHLGPRNIWQNNLDNEIIKKIEENFMSEMKELNYLQ